MFPKRFVLDDIYVSEDAEHVCFGNGQIELRSSKQMGSWTGLTDKVNNIEALGNSEGLPTELIAVGGKTRRINTQPFWVMVDTITLGSGSKYLWHSVETLNETVKLTICSEAEKWRLYPSYSIKPHQATIKRSLEIAYLGPDAALLSSADFIVPKVRIGDPNDCSFEAPGCRVRPHYPLMRLPDNKQLNFGAAPHHIPGLVAVHNPKLGVVLMCWAYNDVEPFIIHVKREGEKVTFIQHLLVADRFRKGHTLTCGSPLITIHRGSWRGALKSFQGFYESVRLTVPKDIPQWAGNARLYELHVCNLTWGKAQENIYCPFMSFDEIIKRLPSIRGLGFNVIQLMPQYPYPGYTVEDYYAVDRTYGPEEGVKRLVDKAHSLGMKVILDLVIHGVVDKSIIEVWRRSVQEAGEGYYFLKSRIIKEFANFVKESPILKQHPEWFMRTETGEIAFTATYAFDYANEAWQGYMVDVMKFYVKRLDVDGFRVDAPGWNAFPNWDLNIPYRASEPFGGCVRMLEKARRELKAVKPDIILYIEATGPLYHRVADFTYNYDEQWLYADLLGVSERAWWGKPSDGEHITAREAAEWFEERKVAFPAGSLKVHHIDSHDTCIRDTWAVVGFGRDRFGVPATRALFALCAFTDGVPMNYVGGEDDSVDFYRKVLTVRDGVSELIWGDCYYTAVECTDDMVFTVLRSFEGNYAIPVINFNPATVYFELAIPTENMGLISESRYLVYDTFNNKLLRGPEGRKYFYGRELGNLRVEMNPYAVSVLLIRRVPT